METNCVSRLAKIQIQKDYNGPFDLFKEWYNNAKCQMIPFSVRVMNIATVSKNGTVSNRSVLMQDFDDEGILFNTTKRSRKQNDIQDHGQVSLCFVWIYHFQGQIFSRQVRMEGIAKEMDLEFTQERFRKSSNRTKLRLDFCKQGNEIDWEELKKRHEKYLQDNLNKDIELPETTIYYKVIPNRIEFYESLVDPITIGDRILYRKNESGKWNFVRLEA